MSLKGIKDEGSYIYRGKVEDMLENKTIEVNDEVVEIKPMFHFRSGKNVGIIIYSIIGNKDLMVISNYNLKRNREFFYWDYERDAHIMNKDRIFKFISELEFLIYNNDIDEDDDYYKTIKDMKKYYLKEFKISEMMKKIDKIIKTDGYSMPQRKEITLQLMDIYNIDFETADKVMTQYSMLCRTTGPELKNLANGNTKRFEEILKLTEEIPTETDVDIKEVEKKEEKKPEIREKKEEKQEVKVKQIKLI